MDEMTIKIEAYETVRKAIEEKIKDAFEPKWSGIIMNSVNEVVDKLKGGEQG